MQEPTTIFDGIVVGGAGGAVAGVTVLLVSALAEKWRERRHRLRIHGWLKAHTSAQPGKRFRSTRAIASHTNLTQDRVRYICSIHADIYLSTGEEDDMWGLHSINPRG